MVAIESILDFARRVVREFQPESIILFGSYAYGNPTSDSDVDLLVVLTFTGKPSRKAIEILRKTNPQIPVDLLVRTPEQVKERIANGDWFLREVLEKGRKLYDAKHSGMGG